MKNKDINRIFTSGLVIWGFVMNFQLMLSFMVSFFIILVIMSCTMITDDMVEMVKNNPAFNNEDESFSGILCIVLFMVLTILLNNLFIGL